MRREIIIIQSKDTRNINEIYKPKWCFDCLAVAFYVYLLFGNASFDNHNIAANKPRCCILIFWSMRLHIVLLLSGQILYVFGNNDLGSSDILHLRSNQNFQCTKPISVTKHFEHISYSVYAISWNQNTLRIYICCITWIRRAVVPLCSRYGVSYLIRFASK